jgi:CHAD domain-containing protein
VLDDPRYPELVARLAAAADKPRLLPDAEDRLARDVLPRLARRQWRRLRSEARGLDADASDDLLHRVRIRAKRCRYAAEAAAPVIGKPARRFARAAESLQDVLGAQHDAVVAEGWLNRAQRNASARQAFVIGMLAGLERVDADAGRAGWRDAWKGLDRKKLRAWM